MPLPFFRWESQDLRKILSPPPEEVAAKEAVIGRWTSGHEGAVLQFQTDIKNTWSKNSRYATAEHAGHSALRWINEIFISGHLALPPMPRKFVYSSWPPNFFLVSYCHFISGSPASLLPSCALGQECSYSHGHFPFHTAEAARSRNKCRRRAVGGRLFCMRNTSNVRF